MADNTTPQGEAAGRIGASEEAIGNSGGETGDRLDASGAAVPPLSDGKAHVAAAPGGQGGVQGEVPDAPRSGS